MGDLKNRFSVQIRDTFVNMIAERPGTALWITMAILNR